VIDIQAVQQVVKSEIGLDENALSIEVVRSAIKNRLNARLELHENQYLDIIINESHEREALCQLLLISESWMLREPVTLEEGKRYLKEIRSIDSSAKVRLLSAPCARGEEVVSLLHIAIEAGFPLSQIEVVGIDLAESALQLARAGIFGEGSFRNTDPHFIERYFVSQKARYQLRPEYLERMVFQRVNLLDSLIQQLGGLFTLVLCRNVLIYLGETEREKVITNLTDLLPEGGFLGVGAAESSLIKKGKFNHRHESISSVFFHQGNRPVRSGRTIPLGRPLKQRKSHSKPIIPRLDESLPKVQSKRSEPVSYTNQEQILKQAFAMADSGNHADAQETCFLLIDQDPLQAEAYYLLGLIAIAQNDKTLSSAYFKRVLYLNPLHEEAKLQLGFQKRIESVQIKIGDKLS
jgi:chemotaxis protein methyltransferase WspC